MQELYDAFKTHGLSAADWQGPRFARIRQIQKLRGEGRLDGSLRWTAQAVPGARP
jgi:hypothetical protein